MLVLSRKAGEEIVIDGNIRVTVVALQNGRVKVGIDAPRDVHIVRGELDNLTEDVVPKAISARSRNVQTTPLPR